MDEAESRARRLGRRYGALVVLVVALAFTGSSAYQITASVFDWNATAFGAVAPDASCVSGIRDLERALDMATMSVNERAASDRVFETSLEPSWSNAAAVEKTCSYTPEGREAYTALLRLRRGRTSLLHRRSEELDPLRDSLERRLAPTP